MVAHQTQPVCLEKLDRLFVSQTVKPEEGDFYQKTIFTTFQLCLVIFSLSIKLASVLTPAGLEKYCSTRIIWGLGPAKLLAEETVVKVARRNLVPWSWVHSASPFTAYTYQSHSTPRQYRGRCVRSETHTLLGNVDSCMNSSVDLFSVLQKSLVRDHYCYN